jgi:micrococcal nuclease
MHRTLLIVLVITVLLIVIGGLVITRAPTPTVSLPPSSSQPPPAAAMIQAEAVDEMVNDSASLPEVTLGGEQYLVLGVVDGDTIDVQINGDSRRVRYIGVNAPETVHPTRGVECFGAEASAYNRALVSGQSVRLEKDMSETDQYGRLLRYVYVDEVLVNEALVAEGYANVSTYPPDVRYTDRFRAAEAAARAAGKGLWGAGCEVYQSPSSQEGGMVTVPSGTNACIIKGNRAQESGERIYHMPDCEYYNQTVISEEKGERWFCSEGEAVAAGWRKAQNCP